MERFCEEIVLALVSENVDGLERLNVDHNFLICFSLIKCDYTAENAKSIFWRVFVKLQLYKNEGYANLCYLLSLVEVIAALTESLVAFDLMFSAPANSYESIAVTFSILSLGGMYRETTEVPLL